MAEPRLIATDLDRTLLPNGSQPESPGAMAAFRRLAGRPDIRIAYVTGRHRGLVEKAIQRYDVPQPDFVIGDVGTTIYRLDGPGDWGQPTGWEEQIARDWGGRDGHGLAAIIGDLDGLRLQPADRQNRCKLSYFLSLDAPREALLDRVSQRLDEAGVAANLIYSIDEAAAVGLLDVLPAGASKLGALRALMSFLGLPPGRVVFAGDSGNDLDVLASELPAVLVANGHDEVREQARHLTRERGHDASLYLARGAFMGFNGNYAAGVLEGVAHYHPDLGQWMEEGPR